MRRFFCACALFTAYCFSFIPHSAYSQTCPSPIVLSGGSSYLYSSVLDTPHARYFAYRRGQTLTIAEITRDTELRITDRFSISIPGGTAVSVAFADGEAVVSFSRTAAARPDNETPESLSWISYYRLTDGAVNWQRTFRASGLDLLPEHGSEAPFYVSDWSFSSWKSMLCNSSAAMLAQQGRVLGASGSRVVIANNAEQFNVCREDPNYYLYHLNLLGEPTTPILESEHCPECQYWWYQLDPGGLIKNGDGTVSRFAFPDDINDPEGEDFIAPHNLRFGPINALRADPVSGGFALALEADPIGFPVRQVGGILFYNSNGGYLGFGSTFAHNGHLAESGALASLGRDQTGSVVFAAGTGRNVPAGSGGFNVPSQFQTEFRPEGGHVGYFYPSGEQFGLDFGDRANDNFGASVAALGDINHDREPDIVVGAPGGNYASVISVIPDQETGARGVMYRISGPGGTRFGQQVGTVSTARNGRADAIIVAANDAIRIYDIGSCLSTTTPALGLRDSLRRVIPQARAALAPIPPRRADRGAVNRPALNMHPALQTFFFKFAAIADALHSSNETLPSNEEIRATELEASYFILNISLNTRDRHMILKQRITPQLEEATRRCPRSQRRRGRSQACRTYRRLSALVADYNAKIASARTEITNMKAVQIRNYDEMENELRQLE